MGDTICEVASQPLSSWGSTIQDDAHYLTFYCMKHPHSVKYLYLCICICICISHLYCTAVHCLTAHLQNAVEWCDAGHLAPMEPSSVGK